MTLEDSEMLGSDLVSLQGLVEKNFPPFPPSIPVSSVLKMHAVCPDALFDA